MGNHRDDILKMINAWISPEVLRKTIAPITALVDEAKLCFEEGGLRVETVDAANVSAISLDLLSDAFHSYEADGTEIAVNLDRFEEIVLKTPGNGNYLIYKSEEDNQLMLSKGGYEFELSLLQLDSVRTGPDPRDIETPATVQLEAEQFTEAIRVASMFSENLRMGIDTNRETFFMNAKGDVDDMHVTFEREDVESLEASNAYGNYSLAILEDIRRAIPTNTTISLGLGEEIPLSIQYQIANDNGRISYGLAPRV